MKRITIGVLLMPLIFPSLNHAADPTSATAQALSTEAKTVHDERQNDPYLAPDSRQTRPTRLWRRGPHVSVQVNVDENGDNILNDAANEPSIAVDSTQPDRIAIGWRQFDNIKSDFRQAGWGHSSDGGNTWTASVIEPGVFRSDPVLISDAEGNFYFNSVSTPAGGFRSDLYRSSDGGASWDGGVFAAGGDKPWMAIDCTDGIGAGNLYSNWNVFGGCCGPNNFVRSIDSGDNFELPIEMPEQFLLAGTTTVGPDGEVYVTGRVIGTAYLMKSTTLKDPGLPAAFDSGTVVPIGGVVVAGNNVNPGGLSGQVWVVVDQSNGIRRGWVYVLASVSHATEQLDLHLVRSTDGGTTWSQPVRVNDDPLGNKNVWQWFPTLAIAPNGRLDAVWNDTRNSGGTVISELFYSFSTDGGETWSSNRPVSPPFDPHLGWPNQNKIGDYYDMVSDNDAAHVAYAATFNGEQDVYYLRIVPEPSVFADGFESGDIASWSGSSIP